MHASKIIHVSERCEPIHLFTINRLEPGSGQPIITDTIFVTHVTGRCKYAKTNTLNLQIPMFLSRGFIICLVILVQDKLTDVRRDWD